MQAQKDIAELAPDELRIQLFDVCDIVVPELRPKGTAEPEVVLVDGLPGHEVEPESRDAFARNL